ncbi:MAG: hypothetical protein HFE77_02895 [Clostridiales bacterium]|nr:hypothetical protein [Clostridiales bacterium]
MEGLEKITDRILQDARAECDAKLNEAKEEISQIKSKYSAQADKLLRDAQEAVQKEVDVILESGKAGASMWRRNALLEAKSAMVDEVYDKAVRFIARMDENAYYALLLNMLKKAVAESIQADSALLADEQSEYVKPEAFVVSLSERDQEKYAQRLCDDMAKIDSSVSIQMTQQPADIAGGVMIQYGDISMDCSIEKSVQLVKSQTEAAVCTVLFGIHASRREQSEG